MSFLFDGNTHLQVTYIPTWTVDQTNEPITIVGWLKAATTGTYRGVVEVGRGEPSSQQALPTIQTFLVNNSLDNVLKRSSVPDSGSHPIIFGTAWRLFVSRYALASPNVISLFCGTTKATDVTYSDDWPGSTTVIPDRIRLGAYWENNNSFRRLVVNERLAHVAIFNRAITDDEVQNATTGMAAGRNPSTFSGCVAYWDGSSLASQVGSLTLSQNGTGTVTVNDADNPTVDAFSGGGGGPSILLTQVERGRTLGRGLGRGLA